MVEFLEFGFWCVCGIGVNNLYKVGNSVVQACNMVHPLPPFLFVCTRLFDLLSSLFKSI